jgi:L-fuconolactonase
VEIVDAQVHVWEGFRSEKDAWRGQRLTEVELLPQLAEAGVQRAVLVPGSWAADGNESGLRAAREHPERFVVMGRFAVEDPAARGTVPAFVAQPGMVGVRLAFRREPHATYLTDGTVDWFWPEAAAAGLQVMVYAPGRIDRIAEVARRHPQLRVIVDHMGVNPESDDAERKSELAQTLAIAELPNVAVKLSALPLYSHQDYPHRDVFELVDPLLAAFGADRCFWGSDMTRLASYRQAVTMLTEAADHLDEATVEAVMGRALRGWLGWA